MLDIMHLVKSQSLYLAPFFNSVVIYFVFVQNPNGELWTTLLKCAPIVFLMFYIVLKGFGFTKEFHNSQRILIGLIFSCAGDALLNIDLFPFGMVAFGIGHVFYISAFGWKPLMLKIGIPMYLAGAVLVGVLFNKLDLILAIGFPIYGALLLTTSWRALARATIKKDFLSTFCAFGTIMFVISDGLIAVDMFMTSIPYSRILIMSTYYVAQFGIALSTANEVKVKKSSPTRSKTPVRRRINDAENVRQRTKTTNKSV
ncbi:lysoplasmalogenase-like protein TMEM86A isoform X2 [Teleopsis dalmanni]|uniref:lysoplasmalogenase-like protein TMEM86A isoform X2 n=1 Tax=Teleopsis dalmanni TaxID=139649 RepID=UPI0018CC7F5D|nr:lysoplasmalogenase-like protein TMEM86A isoform X2 [Teleopsis dalmanni]